MYENYSKEQIESKRDLDYCPKCGHELVGLYTEIELRRLSYRKVCHNCEKGFYIKDETK